MNSFPPALRRTGFVGPMPARRAMATARPPRPRTIVRLWLPLTPLALLLAPFALLLSPLLYLVPWRLGASPLGAALALGRVLLALGGTVVDVDTPDALVRIRIF